MDFQIDQIKFLCYMLSNKNNGIFEFNKEFDLESVVKRTINLSQRKPLYDQNLN